MGEYTSNIHVSFPCGRARVDVVSTARSAVRLNNCHGSLEFVLGPRGYQVHEGYQGLLAMVGWLRLWWRGDNATAPW
jgi:hypothetical protein